MKLKNKAILVGISAAIFPVTAHAQWSVTTYGPGTSAGYTIDSLGAADHVISGQDEQYNFTASYTSSATTDSADFSGTFPTTATQVQGLPSGNNDNFAFQAIGNFTVATSGSYVFGNDTDDGSRLKISINGGAYNEIITDSVLSGSHQALSGAQSLTAGQSVSLEWTWYEDGGGAEGATFYSRDGGTNTLWETAGGGLNLVGGAYNGTVHKARLGTNAGGPNNLVEANLYITSGEIIGPTVTAPIINFGDAGGHIGNEMGFPVGTTDDHFVILGTGLIHVDASQVGNWTFFTNSDDGSSLKINGNLVVSDDFLQGSSDSMYSVYNFPTPGDYPVEYLGFENGGGQTFEVLAKQGDFHADKGFGDATGFQALGDTSNGGLAVVPEPASAAILFGGFTALLGMHRLVGARSKQTFSKVPQPPAEAESSFSESLTRLAV